MKPATMRKRRAGRLSCSTPMATAGATTGSNRTPPSIRKGQTCRGRLLQRGRQSAGRHGLGPVARVRGLVMRCASIRRRSSPKSTRRHCPGYGGRGADIDRNGVFWTSLASGHLGEFDRRKCKVLNGPRATGDHCPEGWTLHRMPGPTFDGVKEDHSAEGSYSTWVDWFNTGGLGENVPIATGNQNSSLLALVGGKWVDLVVPYPMGFFTNGWRAASTMPMPAGRAGAFGPPRRPAPCSISKAARRTGPRW